MPTFIELAPGEVLIQEGEISDCMYWVEEGHLLVTKKNGNEQINLGHVLSEELVGEISFFDQEPRSATVTAVSRSLVVQIKRESLEKILSNQPRWLGILIKTLTERLRKTTNRIKI